MINPHAAPVSKPFQAAVIFLWVAALLAYAVSLVVDLGGIALAAGLACFLYILALIWGLLKSGSPVPTSAEFVALIRFHLPFAALTALLVAALLLVFVVGLAFGPAFVLLAVLTVLGLWVSLVLRNHLDSRSLGLGMLAGLISASGTAFLGNGDLSWALVNLICIPLVFMGGAALVRRTGLARSRFLGGEWLAGLQGFLMGCLLAVPAAVLNLLGNMQSTDTWVRGWWQPFYAVVPAVAEESWARLFLIPFLFALLRPSDGSSLKWATAAAVWISTFAWGFAHTGIDPFGLVIGSLLYGLPSAQLFLKKDFEHALGYHFLIDFARYMAAFLI